MEKSWSSSRSKNSMTASHAQSISQALLITSSIPTYCIRPWLSSTEIIGALYLLAHEKKMGIGATLSDVYWQV